MDSSRRGSLEVLKVTIIVPLLILGFFVSANNGGGVLAQSVEQRIKSKILQSYNASEPPEYARGSPLKVAIQLQVKDFVIQNTYFASSEPIKMMVSASVLLSWIDDRLRWLPADFETEQVVFVKEPQLWTPNFAMDNTFDEDGIHCRSRKCFVQYVGEVTCVSHCTFPARCDYDVRQWPYGAVSCLLRLGSWDSVDDSYMVNSFGTEVVTKRGVGNHQWQMRSIVSNSTTKSSAILINKPFKLVVVTFVAEKINTFYDICLTAPALVLACMNLIVLWLPLTNNMRYVILMLILHGHFVFFQQLSWLAPSDGDNTPHIILFLRSSMFMAAAMIIFITITRRLVSRQDSLPRWIDFLVSLVDSQPLVAVLFPTATDVSCKPTGESSEDCNGLIHGEMSDTVALTYNNQWRRFCLILERLYFMIYVITYAIMFGLYIPSGVAQQPDTLQSQINILE